MLSAGLISHNRIKLLIITADFVALLKIYWICHFYLCFIFAGVESGDQFLVSSEVLSSFPRVMLSTRSPLLYSRVMMSKMPSFVISRKRKV